MPSAALAELQLLREPANARATDPRPNVILSLDDSGSMGWDLRGCMTSDWNAGYYGYLNEPGATGCPSVPPPAEANPLHPSRMRILRDALIATFGDPTPGVNTKGIIEDDRIRLAWQSMWDTGRNHPARVASATTGIQDRLVPGEPNSLRRFSGQHRRNFHAFVSSLAPIYGTPSHKMMSNVRQYMGSANGIHSPFAAHPGVAEQPYVSCRRTYHVLMTDGTWNGDIGGLGNWDGNARTFPDGSLYTLGNAQTRIYRDNWGNANGTLADWALANWATDFSVLPNDVKKIIAVPGAEAVGSTLLEEYWNPKNNPMTWQGVNQYTIGFGNSATNWNSAPAWGSDTHTGADYERLINGQVAWADVMAVEARRPMDLWHMAINGRGKYYQARAAEDLKAAFIDILKTILRQSSAPLASGTSTSLRLGVNGQAYLSGFNGARWSGILNAVTVSASGTISSSNWDAAARLDERNLTTAARNVLTHNGTQATPFAWSSVKDQASVVAALRAGSADTLSVIEQRLSFILGDRSLEQPSGPFRERQSRLGSVVNSVPVLVGPPTLATITDSGRRAFIKAQADRTPAVYVGSNGGMLHGFSAAASSRGDELFAYVPRGVLGKLRDYSLPDYQHQYMVDGTPMVADVQLESGWRTVLVGTLGLGGRGYFALDVTNPTRMTTAQVLFDRSTPGTVGDEALIGHIATPPANDDVDSQRSTQLVKLNDGRWAVVMGNGVNSPSGRAVLLVQYLDGDRSMRPIFTNNDNHANGLSTPRLIDLDNNGTADIAYAGDLKGNLWGFDLSSTDASAWQVRQSGQPLLIARADNGLSQPITTAPYVLRVPRSQQLQIAVGTGRLLGNTDATTDTIAMGAQSLYSVRDPLVYSRNPDGTIKIATPTSTVVRANLVVQTSGALNAGFASTSSNPVNYHGIDSRRGWVMDLPLSGERQVANTQIYQGSVMQFNTLIPPAPQTGEFCNLDQTKTRHFSTYLDIFNGAPAKASVFGLANTAISRIETRSPVNLVIQTATGSLIVRCTDTQCEQDATKNPDTPPPTRMSKTPPRALTVDWRRIQ